MPRFSVVMPTYNRADTIERAIASVRAQRFGDLELLVVDDGSTDGTPARLAAIDEPRMRVITQENQGVAGARNAALRAARGELVAFLDSDDEWPEHHLALMSAFFEAHPGEDLATCEVWEDYGRRRYVKHFHPEMEEWYPGTGRRIGSSFFAGPPRDDDPVLRFYETRAPLGEWARAALAGTSFEGGRHYRGRIFDRWRWGWLTALQPTVLTRRAVEAVGLFDPSYRIACDFGFLAEACRRYPMNFFSGVPGCFKHEYGVEVKPIAEEHLATGRTAILFHQDVLRYLETLFLAASPRDPELLALRGFRQYVVGRTALRQGDRALALRYLDLAVKTYSGADAAALRWLARLVPADAASSFLYRASVETARLPGRVGRRLRRLSAGASA